MALTVNLKPSGVQPVGAGSLVYQWTEGSLVNKENYRVEITFVGTTLPVYEARPDSGNVVKFDVAPALRSDLVLSETVGLRMKNTYVQYQAKWSGSAVGTGGVGFDTAVPLSSDVIYYFIGSNANYLTSRPTFTTKTNAGAGTGYMLLPYDKVNNVNKLYAFAGYRAYADMILADAISANAIVSIDGPTNLGRVYAPRFITEFVGNTPTPPRLLSFNWLTQPLDSKVNILNPDTSTSTKLVINNSDFTVPIKLYRGSPDYSLSTPGANGSELAQTFLTTALSGTFYCVLSITKVGNPTYTVTCGIRNTAAGVPTGGLRAGTSTDYDFSNLDGTNNNIALQFTTGPVVAGTYALCLRPNADGVGDANNYYQINLSAASVYASGSVYSFNGVLTTWTADATRDIGLTIYTQVAAGGGLNSIASAVIVQPDNSNALEQSPLYLKWLNEYGGISTWLFGYNQELNMRPQSYGRYVFKKAYAIAVPYEAWLLINELQRSNLEYNDNFKIGLYTKDFTVESTPLDLVVSEVNSTTQTKHRAHNVFLTLRYPVIQNINI